MWSRGGFWPLHSVPNGVKSETWNFLWKLRKIQIHQQTQGLILANGSALFMQSSCKKYMSFQNCFFFKFVKLHFWDFTHHFNKKFNQKLFWMWSFDDQEYQQKYWPSFILKIINWNNFIITNFKSTFVMDFCFQTFWKICIKSS